jgi:type VI secretion system secreted protein Hcp
MAVEIFLRLDGVTGGSRNYHHSGWADVLGWRWTLDRVAAGVQLNAITVTKPLGIDSPALMTLLAEGRTVASAQIDIVPVVGKREAQQKYVTMIFADVLVKSIHLAGTTEDTASQEEITLSFGHIKFDYHQQGAAATDGRAAAIDVYSFEGATSSA